jgi:hypothetical protein
MEPHEDYLLNDPKLKQRRHSRSLPASPLASPKTMRKFQPQPNPYFTITGSDNNAPKQSWLLTSLFGVRRELTASTVSMSSQIEEAEEVVETNKAPVMPEMRTSDTTKATEEKSSGNVKAKPTLLREMNFWTPTSY